MAVSLHNHTDLGSNQRLIDCITSVKELIEGTAKLGYSGVAITEHETVASHVAAIQTLRKLKENNKIPQNFSLLLGNELYLVDSIKEVRDNYQSGVTKYPHFLIIAKDKKAHELMRKLSSIAWENMFRTGGMERVVTEKHVLREELKKNPGSLIASTACLGSESSQRLLAIRDAEEQGDIDEANYQRGKLDEFINWCIDTFGKENFFIELQPGTSDEQVYVNNKLVPLADHYGLKRVVANDTHYMRPEDREIHKAFLNSKDGEREVDAFYWDAHAHTFDELYEKMNYLGKDIVEEAIENTNIIGNMCEEYTIENETIIPKIDLPDFEVRHLFEQGYEQYQYIEKMAYSDNEQDRYLIKQIEDGFDNKIRSPELTKEYFHKVLDRINMELGELWEISQELGQSMGSYYVTIQDVISVIWNKGNSLVGVGRGSSGGFLVCDLLSITEFNPLNYDIALPHWRHIHQSRADYPDIDIDCEGAKRQQILSALRDHYGEDKVLQVSTVGTLGTRSALQTAARGLGYDNDIALNLGTMIPFERGQLRSLHDCLYGNEKDGHKPIQEIVNEIEKYPKLKETSLSLEGKVVSRSIHAGGVIIYSQPYYKTNAMMRAPNGSPISQFNLKNSEDVGDMKLDLLSIEALDKIRATIDLLIEQEEMDWKGSLRNTFNHYLHPTKLEYDDPKLYEMISTGEVMDLFQFSTQIGVDTIQRVKPDNLIEIAAANSLMRLMSESDVQPIDSFIKHKDNINTWYKEMSDYGLTNKEIEIMKEHLSHSSGIATTQEEIMVLAMDERIAGFSVEWANVLRKVVAKPAKTDLDRVENHFYTNGKKLGTSEELLRYVWKVQIFRQLKYSFSSIHSMLYSLIMFQELNLNYKFDPIYWETACLSVNAGSHELASEGEKQQSTEYGKVASAIGEIMKRGTKISLPDINKADFGFTPDVKNKSIVFGLKGIVGIGDTIIDNIITHRPYASFQDFLTRLFDTKLIQNTHVLQLIKAGCFDSFNTRTNIMEQYINYTFEPRQQLTMQSFNIVNNLNVIPSEYDLQVRFYNFRQYLMKLTDGKSKDRKTKNRLFLLDDISTEFFYEHFTEECIVDFKESQPIVGEWLFEKEYEKLIQPLREWFAEDSTVDLVNKALLKEEWETKASGSVPYWEMSSLSYYYTSHELEGLDEEKYGVVDYNKLPQEPVVTREYEYGGRVRQEFQIHRIAGTVLDKDKNRHTVTVLTEHGVVTVKLYRSNYSHYDKQISSTYNGKKTVLEKSWFTRGELLLFTGFRRGNQFVPRVYRDSIFQHSIQKINSIDEHGNLSLTSERVSIE